MSLKRHLLSPKGSSGRLDGALFLLTDSEKWWRDRYSLLESHGYQLRGRLRPGWIPSWTTNPLVHPEDCEDSVYNFHPQVIEAIRTSDGSNVVLKKVTKDGNEKKIAIFLSSQLDENNHCIPIIDTFVDDADQEVEFIVMPLLRKFDSPPFHLVNEVVDFIQQTLKGIAFMHSKSTAHRDCSVLNIMLDGIPLYPDGFHPIRQDMKRGGKGMAKFINRSSTRGVKYYFTDFGISTRFTNSDKDRLVTGSLCQANVPELSDEVPYDPFAVDIYLLGDVYKRRFIEKFTNVQFLMPLVDKMVQRTPRNRPNADDALKLLEDLVSQKSGRYLRWRLIDAKSGRISRFILNVKCVSWEGFLLTKEVFDIHRVFPSGRKQGSEQGQ